ncbi:MAG: type IV toxin-antitoxin system AbiEi family antitoxin domain-containing protein [Dehalococcoidia bacterium]
MTARSPQTFVERLRARGVARSRDIENWGVSRRDLARLVDRGVVERLSRGLYAAPGGTLSGHDDLIAAAIRVPKGVISLLSALRFHDLTTQSPHEVWMAIGEKDWRPCVAHPPIRFVRFSGAAQREGIEIHEISGVSVPVYSPAKTVADCFKYRRVIGLDVAIEALRDFLRDRRGSVDDLWRYAKICRVARTMRPYIESLA